MSALLRFSSSFSSFELDAAAKSSNSGSRKRFRNEVLLAFQVDALRQTALEIDQDTLSLFSVVDGEGRMRRTHQLAKR